MKNIIYKWLPACLLVLSLVGCKEDTITLSIGAEQKLTTEISTSSAVFGEKVVFTVKLDGMDNTTQTMQEDIDVTLTFSGTVGEGDEKKNVAASDVFVDFTDKIHLHKGDQQGFVEFTVKDGMADYPVDITLKAYARGYQISPAERTLVVSDKHYTVMSLKNNSDFSVREGSSFILVATVGSLAKEDVVINITPDETGAFEDLPESMVVKAGFRTAESDPVKIKRQEGNNIYDSAKLRFSGNSEVHPVYEDEMTITIVDLDGDLGEPFEDERYVYIDPDQIFYSEDSEAEVMVWDMTKKTDGLLMKLNDPHPNEELAAKGWKFLNSLEFHPIKSLTAGDGEPNEWDNRVPRYMAMQAVENTQVYQAMNNEKYSNMTEEGYLMMWSAYDPGLQITEAGSGTRDYGVAGFYANKFKGGNAVNDTWESSNVRILPGTRIEIRMRLRGEKRTFNAALWTQGNRDAGDNAVQWSAYGECDILENPASGNSDNAAWQTFHWADNPDQETQQDNHNPNNGGKQLANMDEFNIYWLEWRDNEEIAMGINGSEQVTIRFSDYPNKYNHWPFSDTFNSEGMHLLLTFGCGSDWALGSKGLSEEEMKAEIDKTLKNIPYAGSKTNSNTPRMEIDWIRFYKTDNYLYKGNGVVTWKNYPMY